ncbi:replication initiation protein, partial [Campylobacter jejuni]|nr:replication initiation protein [Campylobacter jejuni]
EFKIIAVELVRDEYENLSFGSIIHFNAKDQAQFFRMVDTFRKGIR